MLAAPVAFLAVHTAALLYQANSFFHWFSVNRLRCKLVHHSSTMASCLAMRALWQLTHEESWVTGVLTGTLPADRLASSAIVAKPA